MSEKKFQERMKKEFEDAGFFTYRPNDSVTSGVPDIFVSNGDWGLWIEMKYTHDNPEGDTVKLTHPLSAQQSAFLRATGGELLIGFGDGTVMCVEAGDIKPGPNSEFDIADVTETLKLEAR